MAHAHTGKETDRMELRGMLQAPCDDVIVLDAAFLRVAGRPDEDMAKGAVLSGDDLGIDRKPPLHSSLIGRNPGEV